MFRVLILLALATAASATCNNCTCSLDQLTFVKANPSNFGAVDASYKPDCPDPVTGCSRLVAYCPGRPGYMSGMELSGVMPAAPVNGPTYASLTCRNGEWFYITVKVDSVTCWEIQSSK